MAELPTCQHLGRRKRSYRSPAAARKAARRTKERLGFTLRPYKCHGCDRWHLSGEEFRG